MSAATIPVPAAAARSSRNAVCSDRCWSRSCLHRHGLVLARRILQPAPEVVGERAPDVEVEGRPLAVIVAHLVQRDRSEEHTSELQSLMRISYAVYCLTKKTLNTKSDI